MSRDDELLKRIGLKDEEAFNEFHQKYSRRVKGYLVGKLKNPENGRLASLHQLARSMSELRPPAELEPDFFENRLRPRLKAQPTWLDLLRRSIQGLSWRVAGPVAALLMLLAASPMLLRQFMQPTRILLAEAPRPGISAVELKGSTRSISWPSIAVSKGEDYKKVIVAVSLGPDDPQYSKYLFRLLRHPQGSETVPEAETEAADQVALYLKVSGLEEGKYELQCYGRTDSGTPDPQLLDIYPFEIIGQQ